MTVLNGIRGLDAVRRGEVALCAICLSSESRRVWRAQASPVPEEEPPSSALAGVVQHLPLELMDGVVRNLSNDDSVTDSQMLTAISRWVLRLVGVGGLVPHFSLKLLWVGDSGSPQSEARLSYLFAHL